MNNAYLLTGANIGQREQALIAARQQIEADCGKISAVSSLYETAAWGKTDQPSFLNQALQLKTPFTAVELMKRILEIEKKMGRIRQEKFGSRLIDIDILLFNNEIITDPFVQVPHPQMQYRRFALAPLAEIAPALIHPVLKKPVSLLLHECPDMLEVRKIN